VTALNPWDKNMTHANFESLIATIKSSALPVQTIDQEPVRELILKADLIWGFDPQLDTMSLFYGRDKLQDIARGREAEFGPQMLLCFRLDATSNDPATLAKTVQSLRGSCCYEP
jgi:hypothetical protein